MLGLEQSRGSSPHVTETRPPSCDENGSPARSLPTARFHNSARVRSCGGSCGTSLRGDVTSLRLIARSGFYDTRWECHRVIAAIGANYGNSPATIAAGHVVSRKRESARRPRRAPACLALRRNRGGASACSRRPHRRMYETGETTVGPALGMYW